MSVESQVLQHVRSRNFSMTISGGGDLYGTIADVLRIQPAAVRNCLVAHESDGKYSLVVESGKLRAIEPASQSKLAPPGVEKTAHSSSSRSRRRTSTSEIISAELAWTPKQAFAVLKELQTNGFIKDTVAIIELCISQQLGCSREEATALRRQLCEQGLMRRRGLGENSRWEIASDMRTPLPN
jgi:hypothetical protein